MAVVTGWEGRYFEDFNVGDVYRCRIGRTVTENDNIWFTLLTNNTNQIHFNNEYGKRTEFGKCLINSALTLAIVAGMGVADVSENGFALGWDQIRLPNPLFAGDTLYSESEVLEKRDSKSKPQWGIVKVRTRGVQQEGKVVIDYARSVMVWRKEFAPRRDIFRRSSTVSNNDLALSGVRVMAFEQVLAGPFGTGLLGEMGAEVIKIERPGVGDLIRHWDTAVKGLSSGYVWLNRNKRSLTVDVKKPQGLEILHKLAQTSDVFFENYAPGVAERVGLGWETLHEINPRLIYCSLSGYGQTGPYRDVKAYDLLIQGEAGIIATTGYPDKPARAGVSVSDIASGMYAALGIVLALFQREKTGAGQVIDISMFESILSWLGYFPHHYWHRGEEPSRVACGTTTSPPTALTWRGTVST